MTSNPLFWGVPPLLLCGYAPSNQTHNYTHHPPSTPPHPASPSCLSICLVTACQQYLGKSPYPLPIKSDQIKSNHITFATPNLQYYTLPSHTFHPTFCHPTRSTPHSATQHLPPNILPLNTFHPTTCHTPPPIPNLATSNLAKSHLSPHSLLRHTFHLTPYHITPSILLSTTSHLHPSPYLTTHHDITPSTPHSATSHIPPHTRPRHT